MDWLYYAAMWACFIIAGGALLWALMEWRDRRKAHRAQFERGK